jgi:hypothetical protein
MIMTDSNNASSIVIRRHDYDKILPLDKHKLLGMGGDPADMVQFGELVQKNLALYELRNGFALSTHAAANYVRGEVAQGLRSGGMVQLDFLLGGYDADAGPSLYFLDYLSALHKVRVAAGARAARICRVCRAVARVLPGGSLRGWAAAPARAQPLSARGVWAKAAARGGLRAGEAAQPCASTRQQRRAHSRFSRTAAPSRTGRAARAAGASASPARLAVPGRRERVDAAASSRRSQPSARHTPRLLHTHAGERARSLALALARSRSRAIAVSLCNPRRHARLSRSRALSFSRPLARSLAPSLP